ncbi:MAG: L-histidine N(alpha)-methyltransferase [Nitriliruptorales bacterium]|nr:L-histidine N(alpha)-methyltransferase [Nitriliruptorales bacterium]
MTDIRLTELTRPRRLAEEMADDVREGLTGIPRTLPPKYFYDAVGSALFEQITRLDEYYPTRTEAAILADHAASFVADISPWEIIELGSGSSTKTAMLLDALAAVGGRRYVPLDVSPTALEAAARALQRTHPWLSVEPHVGDFHDDVPQIERHGPRLLVFLGSTVGNLDWPQRQVFFKSISGALQAEDGFLLGVDLVKDPRRLVAAYDDAAGVTAAFNRNVLANIGSVLGTDLHPDSFAHEAIWNAVDERIEMWLRASEPLTLSFPSIPLEVPLAAGEGIRTELSCKFRREGLATELADAGLHIDRWETDPDNQFAVAMVRRD